MSPNVIHRTSRQLRPVSNMAVQLFLWAIVLLTTRSMQGSDATPLDDYVNKPDPFYTWTTLNWKYRGPDFTLYVINMTSQMWMSGVESRHPIWWHYLYVAVPDRITRPEAGLLYISYGGNGPNYIPDVDDEFISFITLMAVSTGTVCANLRQVPNQPIVFNNDPSKTERSEDAIIAWTWYQFISHNASAEWLIRLPMTKAAVRAMDTIAAFTKLLNPSVDINKFLVCGESKRGWTTWTTGAVDKRVVAIVPMVMDLLNLVQNLHHHYQALGGWTFAFDDYYKLNITMELDNPNTQRMADIVDPITYKDRLTMPKYIITTGGDEFFLPDDSYYYLDQMLGDTYLRTIPNAEHSLTFHRPSLFLGVRAFYLSVLDAFPRPKITWTKNFTTTGGVLNMFTDTKPVEVNVYFAKTLDGRRRDFRLAVADPNNPDSFLPHPVVWHKTTAEVKSENQYTATFSNPETGWLVFHIQAFFTGPDESYFEFTTENMIIPDRLPFPRCQGAECYGTLV
ncbi:autocrine proliferation repressor protein A-like isoform X2 [Pomacea canaliculata]|nr:autocrine proliferation repressor protein A-like isoform X2 [Pomacea canaliculata]XP_025106924.1 autocrine proliferation repressor protein A-like isoform X2 [Pomacea canaliculata]XP_025106925.1 autocrine proliferation repressor protein A-like isoform X2 [Pomacea canaliculata]